MKLPLLAMLLMLGSPAVLAQSTTGDISVGAEGAVAKAGLSRYAVPARLSHVALAAKVDPDAYVIGAAWLRPTLRRDQLRLRAGVVFELGAIRRNAMGANNNALAEGAQRLQEWLGAMPITGRRIGTILDPYRLEVRPEEDWAVADGDSLYYPRRPEGIRVVGAVEKPCRLALKALQDARRYLASCPASKAADHNRIYVVQPDGTVYEQNTALWNRDVPRPLAPGAWIYVPFDQHAIEGMTDATFSHDVAEFLGTQILTDETWP